MITIFSLRPLQRALPSSNSICTRCLSTSPSFHSGHNRWSKIKHDKGANDMKKNIQNSVFSREIALASKLHGGDPGTNPRLAAILATAKKAGFGKVNMEAAIARGQGKSAEGKTLEALTLEVKFPPSVGMVIDLETDNKLRILPDLRLIAKHHNATITPTSYLFTRKGRVQFDKDERSLTADDVLDEAIEAGAEDVETDEEGNIVLWTEPNRTNAAAQALSKSLNLKIQSTDIIWDANEDTKSTLEASDAVGNFKGFIEKLRDYSGVQGIYANIGQGNLSDEEWEEVQSQLD